MWKPGEIKRETIWKPIGNRKPCGNQKETARTQGGNIK
jgi:hypothetical protein